MTTLTQTTLNLDGAIAQAALDFTETADTILTPEQMEEVIANWINDQLIDITFYTHQLKNRDDFRRAELEAERELQETIEAA